MGEELKPCPFCGQDGEIMAWRDKDGNIELIEHPNTDCIMADVRTYDVDLWNTRQSSDEAVNGKEQG